MKPVQEIDPRSIELSPVTPTIQDLFSLESKRFVVCGAGQGIGAASARALRGLGAEVVCVDREADRAEAIADEVGGMSSDADILAEEGVAQLSDTWGDSIDGIVDI